MDDPEIIASLRKKYDFHMTAEQSASEEIGTDKRFIQRKENL